MFSRRALEISLVCALTLSNFLVFVGCGENADSAPASTTAAAAETTGSPDGETMSEDDLRNAELEKIKPDFGEVDMGGTNFTILTNNWNAADSFAMRNEIFVDELNGEPINDAIYNRNLYVMEKYNCSITHVNMDNVEQSNSKVKKSVKAADGAYDVFFVRHHFYHSLGADGYIIDLYGMPNLDLTAPYWDQNSPKNYSLCNKLFCVDSDISICDKDSTAAMVFNKKLAEDFGLEDVYGVVDDYRWTIDKMGSMAKDVTSDINGDGVLDQYDRYGIYYERDTMLAFLSSGGYALALKDEDDIPYMTFDNESVLTILNDMADVLYDGTLSWNTMYWESNGGEDFNDVKNRNFSNDMALFMWVRIDNTHYLRDMISDFGIIPCPKWKEEQQEYRGWINAWTSVSLSVPNNPDAEKMENLGIMLSDWAWVSTKMLKPAYYDTVLNTKITRDEESSHMLDLIFNNRVNDIGAEAMFGGAQDFIYMSMTNDRDFTSKFAKYASKAQKDIDKLVAKIEELG